MPNHRRASVVAAGFIFTACAATSGSTVIDLFGSTQAAISAADQSGAKDVPAAALYWNLALEQQERAKRLVSAGRASDAEMLLKRASIDAELATTLARQAHAVRLAERAEQKVKAP